MTRSIFDPTGPDTERSGSRNLGPDARNLSHMPPGVTDGAVSEEEVVDAQGVPEAAPDVSPDTQRIAAAESAVAGADARRNNPDDLTVSPSDDLSNPGR